MPPATMTRSPPAPSVAFQPVPYGPRTVSTSPASARASEWLTPPTSRMVCTSGPPAGSPLMEIGTSPAPNVPIMVNCPGANPSGTPSAGSRVRVTVSGVSGRFETTRNGRGIIGGGAARGRIGASRAWNAVSGVMAGRTGRAGAPGRPAAAGT